MSDPRHWTREQDMQMRQMLGDGLSHAEVGSALGRSSASVKQRAQVLSLWQEPNYDALVRQCSMRFLADAARVYRVRA
jgi:hypothetical protein